MDFEKLRKREQDACAALRQLWTVTGKTAAEMERDFGQFFSKVRTDKGARVAERAAHACARVCAG
jgi:hypothetical protein